MTKEELENRFEHHPPATEEVAETHRFIRWRCWQLAESINARISDSREKSLAMTKLEEVMFWSNAAIARNMND